MIISYHIYRYVVQLVLYNDVSFLHSGPRHGVDPAFGRQVEVDLSPERMARAWEAYKARWEREEKRLRQLEENKLVSAKKLRKSWSIERNPPLAAEIPPGV